VFLACTATMLLSSTFGLPPLTLLCSASGMITPSILRIACTPRTRLTATNSQTQVPPIWPDGLDHVIFIAAHPTLDRLARPGAKVLARRGSPLSAGGGVRTPVTAFNATLTP
jgi:hypothetical protein